MKQRYDVLATWVGKSVELHSARWLVGERKHTATACGKEVSSFRLYYVYPPSPWWMASDNPMNWCEKCRSMLIGRLDGGDISPVSNTGVK